MSANQSYLSSTGFDYVVAVTQNSINATLEEYLFQGLPETVLCYTYDSNNNPVITDYATFVKQVGVDPFSVPDGTASSDSRVQALNNAAFAFAVKAQLGLPPGVVPANLPPIVGLKAGQSNVTYTVMFAEFIATELLFGPRGSVTWFNEAQPTGTPWTFTGAVDLDLQDAAFNNLPTAVQQQLKDVGDPQEFSVQQLYYDLNNAGLEQQFTFNNLPSNAALNGFMANDFLATYWKALGAQEVLGYGANQLSATPPSSLAVTNFNFFTPQAIASDAPLTLNYLCATNNDNLPATAAAGFGWDWIDADEAAQSDGVAALNRTTFAQYLNSAQLANGSTLYDYVCSNCYLPWVQVTYEGGIELEVDYAWQLTSGQAPTVTYPTAATSIGIIDPIILSYSYSADASDQAGLDGDAGKMELTPSFTLTVMAQGTQLTVVQHLVVYCYVRYLATPASGNIVDIQITDTYTIGVSGNGQITASGPTSVTVNNSQTPGANGFLNFWANVDDLASSAASWAQSITASNLTDVPVSFIENFVFPGGSTFSFKDASFSEYQDLVAHITYDDPS